VSPASKSISTIVVLISLSWLYPVIELALGTWSFEQYTHPNLRIFCLELIASQLLGVTLIYLPKLRNIGMACLAIHLLAALLLPILRAPVVCLIKSAC